MSIISSDKPLAICSDHAGFELKSIIEGYLEANSIEYKDFGTYSAARAITPISRIRAPKLLSRASVSPA